MEEYKSNRGMSAESPKQIPGRGWKDVLLRVKEQFTSDHIGIVSAGVAFYFFLSLFPMMSAMVAIYGLVFDAAQVEQHLSQLSSILPPQAHDVIAQQLHSIANTPNQGLGLALAFSILLSLWSANSGTKALFDGINIAYNQKEERGFFKLNGISLSITIGAIFVGLIAVALVIGFPALIDKIGLPETVSAIISYGRWPLLFMIIVLSISVIYKLGPNRDSPKFKWVTWGAAIAATLWIAGSLLFSLYINNFGNYEATYGAVAAVIILMLWFQLTSLSVLLGAEINSELEHQTAKDTTVGDPKPLGQRGGYHADHVAAGSEEERRAAEQTNKYKDKEAKDRGSVKSERWFKSKNIKPKTK
jgi:membrane protein